MNDTTATAGTRTDPDFAFASPDAGPQVHAALAPSHPDGPRGPLAGLPGTWTGHEINGAIPNRGLLMPDIEMAGLTCRSASVTQEMVKNPNRVIQNALHGQTIKSRTFIHVSTTHSPVRGGGTANTAFPADAANPPGGNARASQVDAKLWIETVAGPGVGDFLQLQYTQLVELDFNGLRWPHVTVATLRKQ